jgi:ssDNA-binding Zn-finger/Zn-ribbon topoisomerase 1
MKEELKCPKCGSSQTRFRVKTNDRICYVCGNYFKIDEEDKEE